jgi:hypothetical protein
MHNRAKAEAMKSENRKLCPGIVDYLNRTKERFRNVI